MDSYEYEYLFNISSDYDSIKLNNEQVLDHFDDISLDLSIEV